MFKKDNVAVHILYLWRPRVDFPLSASQFQWKGFIHPISIQEDKACVPVEDDDNSNNLGPQSDLPTERKPSILSLKGWRCSSEELAHTFCTFFSHTGRARDRERDRRGQRERRAEEGENRRFLYYFHKSWVQDCISSRACTHTKLR